MADQILVGVELARSLFQVLFEARRGLAELGPPVTTTGLEGLPVRLWRKLHEVGGGAEKIRDNPFKPLYKSVCFAY